MTHRIIKTEDKIVHTVMNLVEFNGSESDSVSSPDKVVAWIVKGILAGRFVPGQKLVEAELLQSLQVSRGPVREAFKRLHGEGIVTLTRHRGAHIRALARDEAADLLIVLEALTVLMATLAATAIKNGANARKMKEAFEVLESFREGKSTDNVLIGSRRYFYDTLMLIGGNRQLPSIVPVMLIHLLRAQSQPYSTDKDRKDLIEEYAAVTAAVLDGEPAKAERAMRRHMHAARNRLDRLPDEAFPAV